MAECHRAHPNPWLWPRAQAITVATSMAMKPITLTAQLVCMPARQDQANHKSRASQCTAPCR